ncbi:splicing factor 3B subunit 1 [Dorcoceras hygrometricum]|uniref:Splicing factor 3B subunit 1 n=1 Tax=Dorcoceras hygrometricum TaxID=472368 RepID=A0A2Z7AYA6_9LAMI|nr:splicing factor 3B subunit 1 [Dorcoceras hygrometricum]
MAFSLIKNASQIYFDSVFGMDNEGMVKMFKALESSGLKGVLGCSSAIYEAALVEFFQNASVQDDKVGAPDLELGESKDFPTLKILTANTVGTYVAKNKNIVVDVDEPVGDEPIVKKKATSKRRPAPAVGEPVAKKKRTTAGRAAPIEKVLAMVPVVQDVEPLSTIQKEPDVVDVVDDVDQIIVQVLIETTQMETDFVEPGITRYAEIELEHSIAVNYEDDNLDGAENEIARKMASSTAPKQFLKEPLISGEDDDMSGSKQPSKIIELAADETDKEIEPVATEDLSLAKSVATMTDSEDTEPLSKVLELTDKSRSNEESMSIADILKQIPEGMMLPSVTAVEITRIKFRLGIEIPGVNEGDWNKASLPRIATSDKGKHAAVEESTLVKVTVAPAGGIGISRYGDISVTHEDLLALVRIEVAAGRHREFSCDCCLVVAADFTKRKGKIAADRLLLNISMDLSESAGEVGRAFVFGDLCGAEFPLLSSSVCYPFEKLYFAGSGNAKLLDFEAFEESLRGPQSPPDDKSNLVVVVVAEVNLQEKEEVVVRKVVLAQETGDIGSEGTNYWIDLDS